MFVNEILTLPSMIFKVFTKKLCHSLKCSPLEGWITPRKVAKTSTQLRGVEGCHGESFALCNRASLKSLAFAASDSSKSSIKIAYPERNGLGKTPVVIV